MLTNRRFQVFCLLAAIAVAGAGCYREGPRRGRTVEGSRVVAEHEEEFILLNRALKKKFSFEIPAQRRVANDRLEVIVQIRNRTNHRQVVDASTIFRDADNVPINDETAWTRLIFDPNQTLTYRATSITSKAALFTVRIRQGE